MTTYKITDVFKSRILICDDCNPFLVRVKKQFLKAGFQNITLCRTPSEARSVCNEREFDLLLVDIYFNGEFGYDLVKHLRASNFTGLIAIISADFSLEALEKSVWCGADDFFIKNTRMHIPTEVTRMLENCLFPRDNRFFSDSITESTFLKCIGIGDFEYRLIQACYPNFPSQKELAYLFDKSEGYIRKTFSGLYKKFQVDGQAQLARMLTFCSRLSQVFTA